jgi:hypothetical protein
LFSRHHGQPGRVVRLRERGTDCYPRRAEVYPECRPHFRDVTILVPECALLADITCDFSCELRLIYVHVPRTNAVVEYAINELGSG